jgi:hypothetical protein
VTRKIIVAVQLSVFDPLQLKRHLQNCKKKGSARALFSVFAATVGGLLIYIRGVCDAYRHFILGLDDPVAPLWSRMVAFSKFDR